MPIRGECPGGDEGVEVQVLGERLAPGVQHQGCRDLAAKPTRVLTELEERCRDALEQQRVEHPGIALCQGVQFMGQRKHQMKVRHRQKLGAPGSEPAFLGERLALRAVPVAAGVVVVAKPPARIAALEVAAERLGAAVLNRAHRPVLHRNKAVRRQIRRPKACEDLGQFYLYPCRIRTGRMRAHGALAVRWIGSLQQIERCVAARQVLLREMEVTRRGTEAPMSEQPLDGVHIGAGFEQMGGKRVALIPRAE